MQTQVTEVDFPAAQELKEQLNQVKALLEEVRLDLKAVKAEMKAEEANVLASRYIDLAEAAEYKGVAITSIRSNPWRQPLFGASAWTTGQKRKWPKEIIEDWTNVWTSGLPRYLEDILDGEDKIFKEVIIPDVIRICKKNQDRLPAKVRLVLKKRGVL